MRRHGNTPPLCRRDALFNEASRPSHPIYRRSTLPPRRARCQIGFKLIRRAAAATDAAVDNAASFQASSIVSVP